MIKRKLYYCEIDLETEDSINFEFCHVIGKKHNVERKFQQLL